ncbi:MAG: hypothetical protein MJ227_02175 [Bacilli bacterium]|nr:hypothetical protein [Bacilli bacterium]
MKINLSSNDLEKLYVLLETKEINLSLSDILNYMYQPIESINNQTISLLMKNNDISLKDAYLILMCNHLELDMENMENISIVNKYIRPYLNEVKIQDFSQNPYYFTVKINEIEENGLKLFTDHYSEYELFPIDDIYVDSSSNFEEFTPVGFSQKAIPFIALNENGKTWMSITPNEINTMQKGIKESDGNVLVAGLGLGYYPFMISLKENVKSITIIENNQIVIELFTKYLLPQFPNKKKIKIIHCDAIEFIKNNQTKYDYAYIDLWHNPNDGLPIYLQIKKIENKSKVNKFGYWLEEGIKQLYRRCFLIVIEEILNGATEKDFKKSFNDIDKVINKLYFETKNVTFNSYDDIIKFLNRLI